jgi:methylated-DNA-protein-cysteine methyltransferase-like protein
VTRSARKVSRHSTATPFGLQRGAVLNRIRRVIHSIPPGRVMTYGSVARAAGYPRAARLTVWALQQATGLPWHRVVAAGGRIALKGEEGEEQRLRLSAERVEFRGERVRMELFEWTPRARAAVRPPRGGSS